MCLTEAEYTDIYSRVYCRSIGKSGGENMRNTLFMKLMDEARAKKRASRAPVAPHKCRCEIRQIRNQYGESVTVEIRK